MDKPSRAGRQINVQNLSEELWAEIEAFIKRYPKMGAKRPLVIAALENYMRLATKYGIDADWNIKLPEDMSNATKP